MTVTKQMLEQLVTVLPAALPEIAHVNRGKLLAGGSHHQHFRFEVTQQSGTTRELVVRIPFTNNERTRRRMLVEHTLLQFLHQQGYDWMPDSLHYDASSSKLSVPFSIQTYIAGTRPRYISKEQASELAYMVAMLHSLTISPTLAAVLTVYQTWEDYVQALLRSMEQWFQTLSSKPPEALVALLPPVQQALQKVSLAAQARTAFMRAATGRQYLVHGDIGRHNLLQVGSDASDEKGRQGGQTRLYLLDWEFAGSGDPAFDIAVIFQGPQQQKQWRTAFTTAYSALMDANSSEDLWQRVAFYGPIVTAHTMLWALGELFASWPGAQSLSQVAWYARTLYNRLTLIDPVANKEVATMLDRALNERFGSSR
ncbi:MAG TPA: aminoglycoside phosphotransferase family protein [Ktedonobacteraceae bacterium]|nr:aminoglycoside phosphotransferase family protein [Ktedonobacteraceae bacterium]